MERARASKIYGLIEMRSAISPATLNTACKQMLIDRRRTQMMINS